MKISWRLLSMIVAVGLAGCPGSPPPAEGSAVPSVAQAATVPPEQDVLPLRGTRWKLVDLGGTPVPAFGDASRAPRLVFDAAADRVSGSGGCNRISGGFTLDGGRLAFTQLISTKMACLDEGATQTEQYFLASLQKVAAYRIAVSALELLDVAGTVVATLEADEALPSSQQP